MAWLGQAAIAGAGGEIWSLVAADADGGKGAGFRVFGQSFHFWTQFQASGLSPGWQNPRGLAVIGVGIGGVRTFTAAACEQPKERNKPEMSFKCPCKACVGMRPRRLQRL